MGNSLEKQIELNAPPQNQTDDDLILTCEICIEPFSSRNLKFQNQNLCTHPFCVDCMMRYIEVKVEENVAIIPCPALHCPNILDPISVRPLLPPTLFNKWCDLLCDSTLLSVERCYCPYENCSALVINECGGDVKKSKCPNCKRLFCFKCKKKWHGRLSCEDSMDGNDVVFGALAARKRWVQCPRCRYFVERVQGCHLIHCRCQTTFCYRCGKRVHECSCDKSIGRIGCFRSGILTICYVILILIAFFSWRCWGQ